MSDCSQKGMITADVIPEENLSGDCDWVAASQVVQRTRCTSRKHSAERRGSV
jgi:hypothetical protein